MCHIGARTSSLVEAASSVASGASRPSDFFTASICENLLLITSGPTYPLDKMRKYKFYVMVWALTSLAKAAIPFESLKRRGAPPCAASTLLTATAICSAEPIVSAISASARSSDAFPRKSRTLSVLSRIASRAALSRASEEGMPTCEGSGRASSHKSITSAELQGRLFALRRETLVSSWQVSRCIFLVGDVENWKCAPDAPSWPTPENPQHTWQSRPRHHQRGTSASAGHPRARGTWSAGPRKPVPDEKDNLKIKVAK